MTFADRLATAVLAKRSITCVGLDPRPSQLPPIIRDSIGSNAPDEWAAAYTQFCCEIIDVVADKVPCVKPQSAFFEQMGPAGVISLAHVIAHARAAGLLVIVDAKRNDIGSTATAYAEAYLGADSQPLFGPRLHRAVRRRLR
jgi:orotidine-5'-phosphate decarboxylase